MVEAGRYDADRALNHYLRWYEGNPPDVGATIGDVLDAVRSGEPVCKATAAQHQRSGGRSAGNGSLMRCAPLAVRYSQDHAALWEAARRDSELTHYDPLAGDACLLFCTVAAARNAGQELLEVPAERDELVDALGASREDAADRAAEQVGFVLTALAVALCADRRAESFEEGLVWAVNLGGDADTNGAVAGAVLGARFGAEAIPGRWLEALEPGRELVSWPMRWLLDGRECSHDGYGGLRNRCRPSGSAPFVRLKHRAPPLG